MSRSFKQGANTCGEDILEQGLPSALNTTPPTNRMFSELLPPCDSVVVAPGAGHVQEAPSHRYLGDT